MQGCKPLSSIIFSITYPVRASAPPPGHRRHSRSRGCGKRQFLWETGLGGGSIETQPGILRNRPERSIHPYPQMRPKESKDPIRSCPAVHHPLHCPRALPSRINWRAPKTASLHPARPPHLKRTQPRIVQLPAPPLPPCNSRSPSWLQHMSTMAAVFSYRVIHNLPGPP